MPILSALGGGSAKGFSGGGGPHPIGEAVFFTLGTTNWTVPAGVRYISVLAVGAGGAGGDSRSSGMDSGGGGALAWANEIPVSGGSTVEVFVGNTNSSGSGTAGRGGEDSYVRVNGTDVVRAGGGTVGNYTGGAVIVGTGYSGGSGGPSYRDGGGGAAGYSANGANQGQNGTGGAGAGGGHGSLINTTTSTYTTRNRYGAGGGGGGVGLYGEQGADPTTAGAGGYSAGGGQGGSLAIEQTHTETGLTIRATGLAGGNGSGYSVAGVGGFPGGGGGAGGRYYRVWASDGRSSNAYYSTALGAQGAVRIIYGKDRLFPATDVGLRQDGHLELFDT